MINIEVKNISDVLNQFDNESITNELDNYIVNKYKSMSLNKKITLNIKGKFTDEEKAMIGRAIHNHYENIEKYYIKIDRHDNIFRIMFLILGVLLIVLSTYFDGMINEFIIIAAWVPIWEAFHDIFFAGVERELKRNMYKNLAHSNIDFEGE